MKKTIIRTLLFLLIIVSCNLGKSTIRDNNVVLPDQNLQTNSNNQETHNRIYHTKKITTTIDMDGNLSEKAWSEVSWSTDFTKKGKAINKRFDTRFKIVYDAKHIYVAVQCLDAAPDSIPLYPSPRDNPSNDWVEVDFDSNHDKETGYAFAISPYGVRTDMFIRGDDADFDDRWHPKWEAKTSVDDKGWKAEMKIPFDQMVLSEIETQVWGLQVTRCIKRRNEYTNWEPMPKGTQGWVSKFGALHGLKAIKGKRVENKKYDAQKIFTPAALKEDVALLKTVLEGVHPSLYRYTGKEKMDSLFASINQELDGSVTEYLFYKKLTKIFNALGDGHSWIRPSNSYNTYVTDNFKMLPLGVKIVDNRIFITKNFSKSNSITKGAEIVSINGKKSDQVIDRLLSFIAADGYNKTWKIDRVSNNFSYYLSLISTNRDQYTLTVRYPDSEKEETTTIMGLLEDDWIKNSLPGNATNYRTNNWDFHVLKDSIGYLSVYTFARGKRFRDFMDQAFAEIESEGIRHLIIDLRDNYGGNDSNGKYLFSYLALQPFYYFKKYETNSSLSKEIIEQIDCCISYEEVDFINAVSSRNEEGVQVLSNYEKSGFDDPEQKLDPKSNAYKGQLYLLTNGGSFSVTSDFCSKVHNTNRGLIIGEETGGGYYGNTSGINKLLVLPNSNLRANINFISFLSHREQRDAPFGRGVIPDYPVKPKQEDIANGVDTELAYVLKLISANGNR